MFMILNLLDNLFFAFFIGMTGWIALQYNKPLMTRTDIRTGKNVSLLMFIHSKYRMQCIFNAERDQMTEDQQRDSFNEQLNFSENPLDEQQNEEMLASIWESLGDDYL